jgi:hypothetical protein
MVKDSGDETSATPDGPNETLCTQCRLSIPDGARVCTHCSSRQDWRGYLGLSSTIIALLVALVSVATTAAPVISKQFGLARSRLNVGVPVIRNGQIQVAITNTGDAPGSIRSVLLVSRYLPTVQTRIDVADAEDAFLPPGSKFVKFNVRLAMSPEKARATMTQLIDKRPQPRLLLTVIGSDGREQDVIRNIPVLELVSLLSQHWERCFELRERTEQNGCDSIAERMDREGWGAAAPAQAKIAPSPDPAAANSAH